jgi:hypothetical protein
MRDRFAFAFAAPFLLMVAACNLIPLQPSTVKTLVGLGKPGSVDGPTEVAMLNRPHGLARSEAGIVVIADRGNHQIRAFDAATGQLKTLAGTGQAGFADGPANIAQFAQPIAVAVSRRGVVYVADRDNHRIRAIDPEGSVTTLAGTGVAGLTDGPAVSAQFNQPYGVAFDEGERSLLVADYLNHSIRKIDLDSGKVSTLAGNGTAGNVDGSGADARFNQPYNVHSDGTGGFLVPDQLNHTIRRLSAAGEVTTIAGSGTAGFADGVGVAAQFNNPTGVTAGPGGEIFVADRNNHRVRRISADGTVRTLAGTGSEGDLDGTLAEATFRRPLDVVFDHALRRLVVSEENGHRLRAIE